jgi:SAM-dependent methyltransferase
MTKSYSRFLLIAFVGSCLIPTVTEAASGLYTTLGAFLDRIGLVLAVSLAAMVIFPRVLRRLAPIIDANACEQASFLDAMPLRHVDLAIAAAAGVSLLLELAVIRWQSSVFPFFAFYTNFGLLACFAGLGLGYALAARDRIPLALVIPLLGWQFALLIGLRSSLLPGQSLLLRSIPVVEQRNMGTHIVHSVEQGFAIYFFLGIVFLLTALTFIPMGQVCGRLMTRRAHLRAYGLNLLGSLGGVVAMFLASTFWTPPPVWYAAGFTVILLLSVWRPPTLVTGLVAAMVAMTILVWPVRDSWQRIYSPYQMLEVGYSPKGTMLIRAAGQYYQRVHDFSVPRSVDDPELRKVRDYYDLPYRIVGATPADVAVVGAGAGNDVAAALRAGAARVDAVEIDPAILQIGGANHPEHPYADRRVHAVLADARSFLRTTDHRYDLIVYGLLDSHTLLSQASSVRLDSFVYTVQGFREARARLKPGGRIVLSFSILNDELGRKMEEMLRQAFDGADPVVISAGYDGAVTFMQSNEGNLTLSPAAIEGTGFEVTTRFAERTGVDPSTDDWPFFYMPHRVYPVSYLVMLGMVLLVTLALSAGFIGERPRVSEASFAFLGAGFMLVETKAITELGLMFGNTWRVIGIVIAGILLMAFLANAAVQWFNVRRPQAAFVLLLVTLAAGWFVMGTGGLPSTMAGRVATVALLTCPMLFSGIVFSTLLGARGRDAIARVMAANLVGAMCGGLLEYNSMYFGFRFLYLLAMAFYAAGFAAWLASERSVAVDAVAPSEGSEVTARVA